jgi:16S rRNA (cytidine1402-2'-O)-methyltransferase
VLFESPRRVAATLEDLAAALGDRPAAVCRELTKLHEEVLRGSLRELAAELRRRGEVRGEIVVVVGGAPGGAESRPEADPEDLARQAADLVAAGTRRRQAAAEVARRHGVSTNEVYRALLALDRAGDST